MLQTRADGLLDYPIGRSAMIFYDHSGDAGTLRDYVKGTGAALLAKAARAGARWVRWAETPHPADEYARLLASFTERFGAPPIGNASTPMPVA